MQDECTQFFPFVSIKEININRNEDFNRLDITLTYVATNFGIEDEINIQL